MNHYIADSATPDWLLMSCQLKRDDGHTYEYRDGLHTVDGVVSILSYASARELMAEEA